MKKAIISAALTFLTGLIFWKATLHVGEGFEFLPYYIIGFVTTAIGFISLPISITHLTVKKSVFKFNAKLINFSLYFLMFFSITFLLGAITTIVMTY